MCVCAAVVRQLQLMGNIAYTPRPHLRKSLDSAQLCLAVIFCRCSNFSKYQMDWAEWVHVCVCIRIKGYWSAPHQVAWLQGGTGNHYASAWGRTFFLFSSALCLFLRRLFRGAARQHGQGQARRGLQIGPCIAWQMYLPSVCVAGMWEGCVRVCMRHVASKCISVYALFVMRFVFVLAGVCPCVCESVYEYMRVCVSVCAVFPASVIFIIIISLFFPHNYRFKSVFKELLSDCRPLSLSLSLWHVALGHFLSPKNDSLWKFISHAHDKAMSGALCIFVLSKTKTKQGLALIIKQSQQGRQWVRRKRGNESLHD